MPVKNSFNYFQNFDPHSFIKDPLLFGNFMKMGCPPEEKFYEEISDMNKLQHVLGEVTNCYLMISKIYIV